MVALASQKYSQPFCNEKSASLHLSVNKIVSKSCYKLKTEKLRLVSTVHWKQITLVISQGSVGSGLFGHISLC